ncbi:hypothetical protein niasHS_009968 [Heterodera schachtii]|uniref:Uncharacterized protein n=1 Tax=Heterodera schachtii TaxID=97005 RepID=A0ABD2JD57_HETSC
MLPPQSSSAEQPELIGNFLFNDPQMEENEMAETSHFDGEGLGTPLTTESDSSDYYESANENNSNEPSLADDDDSHKKEILQMEDNYNNNNAGKMEETENIWNETFNADEQKMPKKKWLCPEGIRGDHAHNETVHKCRILKFANKALRNYLRFHALRVFNEEEANGMEKLAFIQKEDLLENLALKPSFLSSSNDNISEIKIILLKAYKHFNITPEEENLSEFEKIAQNFANKENYEKVQKLVKAFKMSRALERKCKSQGNGNKAKRTTQKYRKALEKVKAEMVKDADYCKDCSIPTVTQVLATPIPLSEQTKELMQKGAKKFDEKFKTFTKRA